MLSDRCPLRIDGRIDPTFPSETGGLLGTSQEHVRVSSRGPHGQTKYRRVRRGRGESRACPKHPRQCRVYKVEPGDPT